MNKKGFSLIELMVVISIIGVLMAVGAVSYVTAQRKGRDSSRRADMKAVSQALEQYFAVNGQYPPNSGCGELDDTQNFLPAGFPSDPKPSESYDIACTTNSYCVCAELENESGNSTNGSCNFGTGNFFCVVNQQ